MNSQTDKYLLAWKSCQSQFRKLIPAEEYICWVYPLALYGFENGTLMISVPNNSHASFIDTNYMTIMKPIIVKEFGGEVRGLKYILADKKPIAQSSDGVTESAPHLSTIDNFIKKSTPNKETNPLVAPGVNKIEVDSQLNFDLTFENFIEGDCNKLARAAGLSVAANPGKEFNPMFIYGDSGLGKTHVAQAVGIEVKKRYPTKNVLYVTTQKFVDQFTAASHNREVSVFVKFYQMMDVLIVDDIQELSGKPQTQIVFFNIFNHLHQSGKQMIFTSDKSPAELTDIENRIVSRFKWALSVQLLAPDFETKVAIIKSKSRRYNIELSDDVVEFLAENIHTNVRELEGAVSSFAAHSSLLGIPATIELARKILGSYVKKTKREITIELIKEVVCEHYNVKKTELTVKSRVREVVLARQVAMYLAKEYTELSLKGIGAAIGGKSHSTVVHSCSAVSNLIETDREFKKNIDQMRKSLR